jgi:DNA-binding NtrC family response regulator
MAPERNTRLQKTTLGSQGTATAATGDAATVALTVLYHPHLERVGDRAVLRDLSTGRAVPVSRTEPAFAPPGRGAGEPLLDEHLSRNPLQFVAMAGGGVRLDAGDSGTAVVVRGQRVRGSVAFTAEQVRRGVVLELGHRVVLLLHIVTSLEDVLEASNAPGATHKLVGESEALRRVLWEIRSVADLELPVLLRGETGSGKELVAQAIHQESPRRDRPFVAVNLGAVVPSLAVAELFGAEKGAYTGSVKRQTGYFEQARGGTLFLDEIGDSPIELQVALLRVLETGEMQSVGAQQVRKADVRIIAATDADLEGKVAAGTFRAPLLNRISAYEIWIPPLRERRDDIGRLLANFLREELDVTGESHRLKRAEAGGKPWIPSALVATLADYDWPGNVRQLRNVVRQLVIGNRGREHAEATVAVERLLAEPARASAEPAFVAPTAELDPAPAREIAAPPAATSLPQSSGKPAKAASRAGSSAARKPADVTEEELDQTLRACRWDFAAAAQRLGISRASIYLLIDRYPRFRAAGDLTPEEITRSYREHKGDIARMAEQLEVSERALGRRVRELGLE